MGIESVPYQSFRRNYPAGAAHAHRLRVRLNAGSLALCGASDVDEIGVVMGGTTTADRDVLLRSAPCNAPMTAAGAISLGAAVYAAANGKVASSGTVQVGVALNATAADGDAIEVARV
jgi:hypothetical protein